MGAEDEAVEVTEPAAPVADETAPVVETQPAEVKMNPAWEPLLAKLPKEFHGIIAPDLKDWDRGVNERFEAKAKEFEPFKPFQELLDNGVSLEDIQQSLGLMQQINEEPETVWKAMQEYYKFGETPSEVEPQEEYEFETPEAKQIAELKVGFDELRGLITGERQQAEEAAADRAFEELLGNLEAEHGEYDRDYVITQIANGAKPEDAVKAYHALVEKIKVDANKPQPPKVLGSGAGGLPAEPTSTTKMSGSERRKFMADMLRANKEANG